MNKSLNVCFLGDGNHAKRIKRIANEIGVSFNLTHFNRDVDICLQSQVLSCDIIFITSPNFTHAKYLSKLNNIFKGYIYCEKPVVNRIEDLSIFNNLDFTKCFFGFNLRYSEIASFFHMSSDKYNLGNVLNVNISVGYPFALRPEYKSSWKSDSLKSPLGVVENLAIHYVDLVAFILKDYPKIFRLDRNVLKASEVSDTSSLFCKFSKKKVIGNIFVSYACGNHEEVSILCERGRIIYNGSTISLYYPRESYDSNGLSIEPPVVVSNDLSSDRLYENSLFECINTFLQVVVGHGSFNELLGEHTKYIVSSLFDIEDKK